jgi:hypothetical protein
VRWQEEVTHLGKLSNTTFLFGKSEKKLHLNVTERLIKSNLKEHGA